jgi:iron complex transport system substrate-binding protein
VGTAKEFDLEGCAALSPDLVILPLKLKSAVESLEALGIKVLLVNPEDQSLLTEMIELISTATNSVSRGQQLLDFYETQQKALTQKLSGVSEPSVYLAGNSSLLSTAGEEMYQSSLISLAGGKNAASTIKDTYWATIDYEQLLAWNPEYIILASDADYSCEDVLSDPNLAECQAVVNGNVYQMPSTAEAWDSPVPSGILGAVWLANVLHPDKLSKDECNSLIEEYYETFYNFTYPQE